jgi:hypothetical protein
MSSEFWSNECQSALIEEGQDITKLKLYSSHGFAIGCFFIGCVLSGYWLYRWRCIRQSNRDRVVLMWHFLGFFLIVSFSCCLSGLAAWISKMILISSNFEIASIPASDSVLDQSCKSFVSLLIEANQSQSCARIFYALEIACFFLSILLGIDRITEHALCAKNLSKKRPGQMPSTEQQQSEKSLLNNFWAGQSADRQPLAENSSKCRPHLTRTRALQLLLKLSIIFVALVSFIALASEVSAASIQAQMSQDYNRARDECNSDGSWSEEAENIMYMTHNSHKSALMLSIFVSYTSEVVGAFVVLFLYLVVGLLIFPILRRARKKLEDSRSKLQEFSATIGNTQDAKAAVAGDLNIHAPLLILHL